MTTILTCELSPGDVLPAYYMLRSPGSTIAEPKMVIVAHATSKGYSINTLELSERAIIVRAYAGTGTCDILCRGDK